jgi:hypothetical protein
MRVQFTKANGKDKTKRSNRRDMKQNSSVKTQLLMTNHKCDNGRSFIFFIKSMITQRAWEHTRNTFKISFVLFDYLLFFFIHDTRREGIKNIVSLLQTADG